MAFDTAIISTATKAQIVPISSQSLDPRELMIEDLNEEAGGMQVQFAKALAVFQEKQAVLTSTLQSITKKNEELQASYIVSEGRNKEIEAMYQAQIKAMIEKEEQRSKEHLLKINNILKFVEDISARQTPAILCNFINELILMFPPGNTFSTAMNAEAKADLSENMGKLDPAFRSRQLPNGLMPNLDIFAEETKADTQAIKTRLLNMKEDLEKSVKK